MCTGQTFELTTDVVTVEMKTIRETVREFTPNVIEPSFGIGRIFYSLLEHSFWTRAEDQDRGVLSLPPLVAPIKALIVPISSNEKLTPLVKQVSRKLRSPVSHRESTTRTPVSDDDTHETTSWALLSPARSTLPV